MSDNLEFEDTGAVVPLDIPVSAPGSEVAVKPAERTVAELEAYKRHFAALQSELSEIEQQYQTSSDPAASALEKRVSGIEKGMEEIKELLTQRNNAPASPAVAPAPVPYYPQAVPQYQPMPSIYSTPAPMIPPLVTYR